MDDLNLINIISSQCTSNNGKAASYNTSSHCSISPATTCMHIILWKPRLKSISSHPYSSVWTQKYHPFESGLHFCSHPVVSSFYKTFCPDQSNGCWIGMFQFQPSPLKSDTGFKLSIKIACGVCILVTSGGGWKFDNCNFYKRWLHEASTVFFGLKISPKIALIN